MLNFCHIQAVIFFYHHDYAGWSLTGNRKQRIRRISGVKSGRSRLRNLLSLLNKMLNFCHIQAVIFFYHHDYAGWSLTGNRKQRIRRISGVKSGRSRLRNLLSGRLRENFWKSVYLTNKTAISKVVTYEKWSIWELTVLWGWNWTFFIK